VCSISGAHPESLSPKHHLAMHDIRVKEGYIRELGDKLLDMEKCIGISPFSWLGPNKRDKWSIPSNEEAFHGEVPIERVAYWSRELGNHLVAATQLLRSADVAEAALNDVGEMLIDQGAEPDDFCALEDLVRVVRQQPQSTCADIRYLQERARTHSSVVNIPIYHSS
jgi:hypothetical protein